MILFNSFFQTPQHKVKNENRQKKYMILERHLNQDFNVVKQCRTENAYKGHHAQYLYVN